MRILTSSLVRSLLTAIRHLFFSILYVGVIDHPYPEDGKTIFQDIGASKAPRSDCPAAPAGSPSDCSTTRHRQDPDTMAIPQTRWLYPDTSEQ